MMLAISLLGLILVVSNVGVTLTIARSDSYTRNQKLLQSVIVWLLPIIGAGRGLQSPWFP
jgi:hypothetical protein